KVFDKRVDISPPTISQPDPPNEIDVNALPEEDIFVKVSFRLEVGQLIDSHMMQLVPLPFAKSLVEQLLQQSAPAQGKEEAAAAAEPLDKQTDKTKREMETSRPKDKSSRPQFIGKPADHTTVEQASFAEFEHVELDKNEQRNLDL